jgi:hypothetical protein
VHRLVTSAFVHVDNTHLISNLAAAVPDCLYLERTQGSVALALDTAGLTLLSHSLYGEARPRVPGARPGHDAFLGDVQAAGGLGGAGCRRAGMGPPCEACSSPWGAPPGRAERLAGGLAAAASGQRSSSSPPAPAPLHACSGVRPAGEGAAQGQAHLLLGGGGGLLGGGLRAQGGGRGQVGGRALLPGANPTHPTPPHPTPINPSTHWPACCQGPDALTCACRRRRCCRRTGQQAAVIPGVSLPAQYTWVYSLAMTTLLVRVCACVCACPGGRGGWSGAGPGRAACMRSGGGGAAAAAALCATQRHTIAGAWRVGGATATPVSRSGPLAARGSWLCPGGPLPGPPPAALCPAGAPGQLPGPPVRRGRGAAARVPARAGWAAGSSGRLLRPMLLQARLRQMASTRGHSPAACWRCGGSADLAPSTGAALQRWSSCT